MPRVSDCKILVLYGTPYKHRLYEKAHNMVEDAEIAAHVLALYEFNNGPKVRWTCVSTLGGNDGIRWGLARVKDSKNFTYDLIVFRGTTTIRDIIRDLVAIALPFGHREMGPIHAGFWDGMSQSFHNIKPFIKNPVIVAGHSLGGGHACVFAGLLLLAHMAPAYLCTFGGPRVGFTQFSKFIEPVNKRLYVNKYDIIPDLPLRLAIEDYVDSGPRTWIDSPPTTTTEWLWGPFSWHHMELYRSAIK